MLAQEGTPEGPPAGGQAAPRAGRAARSPRDGLRMIAYRAETLVAATVAPNLGQPATVCSFAKALLQADANTMPDPDAGVLRAQLLPLATTAPGRQRGGPVHAPQRPPDDLFPLQDAPRVRNPIRKPGGGPVGWRARLAVLPACIRRTAPPLHLAGKLRLAAKPQRTAILTGYLS